MAERRTPIVVTTDWLRARGGLHDAYIVAVQRTDSLMIIQIDDEWANFRDGTDDRIPGQFELHGAVLSAGDEDELPAASISKFALQPNGIVRLNCCKGRFRIAVDGISFSASINSR